MRTRRLLISVVMALVLLLSFGSMAMANEVDLSKPLLQSEIKLKINKNLDGTQVQERFIEINSKYDMYEPFSKEDAEFIRAYAKVPQSALATTVETQSVETQNFNVNKTSQSVSANFSGSLTSTINYVTHSYGGNITAKVTLGNTKVNGMDLVITNLAYGVIGTTGTYIGIVSDTEIFSSTTNNTSYNMNRTKEYGAVGVLFTYTNAHAVIKTTTGNFDIYAFN